MSVNSNMQNLVTYVDFKHNKVTIMLNFGVSCKTAKIEEYTFDYDISNLDALEGFLFGVLKAFVSENACDKADCYLVLSSNVVSYDYIKIPNFGLVANVKPKVLLKTEIDKIFKNSNNLTVESDLVLKTKKNLVYKCCFTKKQYIDRFSELYKKIGLNLKNISFDASAFVNSVMALTKTKLSQFVCLNVRQKSTQVMYCFKGQLMSFYNMPFGTLDIINQKVTGAFNTCEDAINEVYLVNEASKSNISSALFNEDDLLKNQHQTWEKMQLDIPELSYGIFAPLIKAVMMINETVANYDFSPADTVFVNIDNEFAKQFKAVCNNKKGAYSIKFLEDEFVVPCGLKDYLHLYGMIYAFKYQKGNNFADKETKPKTLFG